MTFKISSIVTKIASPIVVIAEEFEQEYSSGEDLANSEFNKQYLIDSISAKGDKIVISLKENMITGDTSWCCGEEASFF